MATTAYLCVSTRNPEPAILPQKQVSKASIAKMVGVSLPPLPLYQDKAVTPTPLKDIFTSIWAGPLLGITDHLFKAFLQTCNPPVRSANICMNLDNLCRGMRHTVGLTSSN